MRPSVSQDHPLYNLSAMLDEKHPEYDRTSPFSALLAALGTDRLRQLAETCCYLTTVDDAAKAAARITAIPGVGAALYNGFSDLRSSETVELGPLLATLDKAGPELWLGAGWQRWPLNLHFDSGMPANDRERVAIVLETAGADDPNVPQRSVECPITGEALTTSERVIPGDRVAKTNPLRVITVLSHYVRTYGLRIDPKLLYQRFGVHADGRRPAIVPSGHA